MVCTHCDETSCTECDKMRLVVHTVTIRVVVHAVMRVVHTATMRLVVQCRFIKNSTKIQLV